MKFICVVLVVIISMCIFECRGFSFQACNDNELYFGNSSNLLCVNTQTGKTRLSADLWDQNLPVGQQGQILAINGKGVYAGYNRTDDLSELAVYIDTATSSVTQSGNGFALKDVDQPWTDIQYDYVNDVIYGTIDLTDAPGLNVRHLFKFQNPSDVNYVLVLNITLDCTLCQVYATSVASALDVKNQIYYGIVGNFGGGYIEFISVNLVKKQFYSTTTNKWGFYGLAAMAFNPADGQIYGYLPLATDDYLYNTTIVTIDPSNAISTLVSLVGVPAKVPISQYQSLPLSVSFNFKQSVVYAVYMNVTESGCYQFVLYTIDIASGKVTNSAPMQPLYCDESYLSVPWGLASMNYF